MGREVADIANATRARAGLAVDGLRDSQNGECPGVLPSSRSGLKAPDLGHPPQDPVPAWHAARSVLRDLRHVDTADNENGAVGGCHGR